LLLAGPGLRASLVALLPLHVARRNVVCPASLAAAVFDFSATAAFIRTMGSF
jgi:hypothetical protein